MPARRRNQQPALAAAAGPKSAKKRIRARAQQASVAKTVAAAAAEPAKPRKRTRAAGQRRRGGGAGAGDVAAASVGTTAVSSALAAGKGGTLRVLYVGNSFTTRHDLPGLIRARLAELRPDLFGSTTATPTQPKTVVLEQRLSCSGGASLVQRVNDKRGAFREVLSEFRPQLVVLQEQSSKPWKAPERFKQAARDLSEKISIASGGVGGSGAGSGATVLLYQTTPWEECTPAQEAALFEGYRAVAAELSAQGSGAGAAAAASPPPAKKKGRHQATGNTSRNRSVPSSVVVGGGGGHRRCALVPVGDAWCVLRARVLAAADDGTASAVSSEGGDGADGTKAALRRLGGRGLWDRKDGRHPGVPTAHLAADVFARVMSRVALPPPTVDPRDRVDDDGVAVDEEGDGGGDGGNAVAAASGKGAGPGKRAAKGGRGAKEISLSQAELAVLRAIGRDTVAAAAAAGSC